MLRTFAAVAMLVSLTGCGGETGPKKHPVTGRVDVNGNPALYVRVQFLHADQSLPGNLKMPVGMTDDSGVFHLSTTGDKDGAIEGDYTVVFEWMSANDLGAFDKFGGKFSNAKTSTFKVKVEAKRNELAPFELTIPEAAIATKSPRGQ